MLHSALINVMVKAARRAGRSLKRDLGEIEHLQVSLKGRPISSRSPTARRGMLYDDLTKAARVTASSAKRAEPRGRRQEPHLDRRPLDGTTISCTAFRNSRSRSRSSAKAPDRRRDLQSRQ